MANEETGFGKWEDKVLKNTSRPCVYEHMSYYDIVGTINDDKEKVMDVGVPFRCVITALGSFRPTQHQPLSIKPQLH